MGRSKVVVGNEVIMDLTADTVTADKLLRGITAHGKDGELVTGTCDYDVDTTEADAAVGEVLYGKTFAARGSMLTGTMPNRGAIDGAITDRDTPYVVPLGFHDGSGTVGLGSTDKAKLIPSNIKKDVVILGITGDYGGEAVTAQSKTVTPTMSQQTVLPDPAYDYLSQVIVTAIPVTETPNAAGGTTVTIGAAV